MPHDISIVSCSILSSLEGHYGNHHATNSTHGSHLWINPLMAVYWSFTIDGVVERNMLIPSVHNTETENDVEAALKRRRRELTDELPTRRRQTIPN